MIIFVFFFFFQAEDGIRDKLVTGVQTCALPILVSRERKFSILLKNPRADLENEREVYKTFIAGSIPGVILSAQSLARPDGHGSGTGHLGDRSTGRNPVSGGQAGDAKAPSASAVSRSPSASAVRDRHSRSRPAFDGSTQARRTSPARGGA